MMTDRTKIAIVNTRNCIWSFDWHIYIWLWPIRTVKVMHIWIGNISKRAVHTANITCHQIRYRMLAFVLAYLELIMIYSKGQLGHCNVVSSNNWAFLFQWCSSSTIYCIATIDKAQSVPVLCYIAQLDKLLILLFIPVSYLLSTVYYFNLFSNFRTLSKIL